MQGNASVTFGYETYFCAMSLINTPVLLEQIIGFPFPVQDREGK